MLQISLTPRNCPICGRQDDSRAFAEANFRLESLDGFAFASRKVPEYMHWRLMHCQKCDLLYANPAPAPDDLASLYRDADFDSGKEAGLASRTYGQFLPALAAQLPDKDGAVDVGTGDGIFLRELLDAGFTNVAGVEPSSAPIEAADPAIRPLIRHDIFRPNSFPPDSLSLITCFQTIEHLAEPLAFCQDAARALKAGRGPLPDRPQSPGALGQGPRPQVADLRHRAPPALLEGERPEPAQGGGILAR